MWDIQLDNGLLWLENFKVNVECVYGQQLWSGLVKDYDAQYDDYIINFLQPQGVAQSYTYPTKENRYLVEAGNILGTVEVGLKERTRIQYVFPRDDVESFADAQDSINLIFLCINICRYGDQFINTAICYPCIKHVQCYSPCMKLL